VEPKQTGAREKHVDWPTETLPWVYVAYKGPAYTDSELDTVGLDVLATLAFSENSDLYRKLVIEEQKVDQLGGSGPANVDPSLFTISARVKDAKDVDYVRGEILKTIERFREELIAGDKLEAVKKRERYSFVMRMDNNEAVARNAAFFVALKRTPATIDRMYEQYDKLTPALIRAIARRYLSEDNRTIVTLTGPGGEAPAGGAQ
jgi:zinc protease